jgi:hypothetical protein
MRWCSVGVLLWLVVVGCPTEAGEAKDTAKKLLGRWEGYVYTSSADKEFKSKLLTLEFKADGTFLGTFEGGKASLKGDYRVLDKKSMEWGPATRKQRADIEFRKGKRLVLTVIGKKAANKQRYELERAK